MTASERLAGWRGCVVATMRSMVDRHYALPAAWMLLLLVWPALSPAEDWQYTVRPGDNLWNISERHLTGVDWVPRLQALNRVADPYHLQPGTELRIPVEWARQRSAKASVLSVEGAVEIHSPARAQAQPAVPGLALSDGDSIQVGDAAHVTIRFEGGAQTRIAAGSTVTLRQLRVLGDEALIDTRLQVPDGRTESDVPAPRPSSRSRLRIETPAGVTSVRGTGFRVCAQAKQARTLTEVTQGQVEVDGQGRAVTVPAGSGTITTDGQPPQAPVTLLPAPTLAAVPAVIERLPLRLTLTAQPEAAAYRAQVARDADFTQLVADFSGSSAQLLGPELADGDYWLRVRAIDRHGLEGLDAGRPLRINARPEPPLTQQPTPDGVVAGAELGFAWAEHPHASGYVLEVVDPAATDATSLYRYPVTGARFTLPQTLSPGRYGWRMRTIAGDDDAGPWSDVSAFRVVHPGPGLDAPDLSETTLTLAWSSPGPGYRFKFQMARDAGFQQSVLEQELSEPRIELPKPRAGRYQVRVAVIEPDGVIGPWGTAQSIEVPRKPPYWLAVVAAVLVLL